MLKLLPPTPPFFLDSASIPTSLPPTPKWHRGTGNGVCSQFITRCLCCSLLLRGRTPHTLSLLQLEVPLTGDISPQTSPTWVLPMGCSPSLTAPVWVLPMGCSSAPVWVHLRAGWHWLYQTGGSISQLLKEAIPIAPHSTKTLPHTYNTW